MAITKIQSESLNLADTYDFTGTVTGAGGVNTPAFYAYQTTGQAISFATSTALIFNVKEFDTDNAFDTSTGGFTVPSGKAGKYQFYANVAFSNAVTDNHCGFTVNGSTALFGAGYDTYREMKGTIASQVSSSAILDLSVGDVVKVVNFNVNSSVPTTSGGRTRFQGYKLVE
jgi:hypothetical protein